MSEASKADLSRCYLEAAKLKGKKFDESKIQENWNLRRKERGKGVGCWFAKAERQKVSDFFGVVWSWHLVGLSGRRHCPCNQPEPIRPLPLAFLILAPPH